MIGPCLCAGCVDAWLCARYFTPSRRRYLSVERSPAEQHRAEAERLFALRFAAREKTGATCP